MATVAMRTNCCTAPVNFHTPPQPTQKDLSFTKIYDYYWTIPIPPLARIVLFCLLRYAFNGKTSCYPSQVTLSKDCKLSERCVRKQLRILEALGLIVIQRFGHKKNNEYFLLCKEIVEKAKPLAVDFPEEYHTPAPRAAIFPISPAPRASESEQKNKSDNNSKILIRKPKQTPAPEPPVNLVVVSLGRIGINKEVAQVYIQEYGIERVQEQLNALNYRNYRDPAAMFVDSLKRNYSLPTKLIEEQKQKELQAKAITEKTAQIKAEQEHAEKVKKEAELIESIPHLIPAEQLEVITREATENLAVKKILPGRAGFTISLKFEVLRIVREKGMIDESSGAEVLARAVT
jgi:hypothetical protein